MNVLVLDDSLKRWAQFASTLAGARVTYVRDVDRAIHWLRSIEFDAVFLGETGYEVARWLEQHPDNRPKAIVIHCFNPDSHIIKQVLPEAVQLAGCWADEDLFEYVEGTCEIVDGLANDYS